MEYKTGDYIYTIQSQPKNQWEMRLKSNPNLIFYFAKAPNWFHRLMQKWILGFEWVKLEDEDDYY